MNELEIVKAELARIKDGIKHLDMMMLIDGNDMVDYGWTTIERANARILEHGGTYPKKELQIIEAASERSTMDQIMDDAIRETEQEFKEN